MLKSYVPNDVVSFISEAIHPDFWSNYSDAFGTKAEDETDADTATDVDDEDNTGAEPDTVPPSVEDRMDDFKETADIIMKIMDVEDAGELVVSDIAYEDVYGDESQAQEFIRMFGNESSEVDIPDEYKSLRIPDGGGMRKGYTIYFYLYEFHGRRYLVMKVVDALEYYRVVIREKDLEHFVDNAPAPKETDALKYYDRERAEIEKEIRDRESMMGSQHRNN